MSNPCFACPQYGWCLNWISGEDESDKCDILLECMIDKGRTEYRLAWDAYTKLFYNDDQTFRHLKRGDIL